jgi:hypothetical protein
MQTYCPKRYFLYLPSADRAPSYEMLPAKNDVTTISETKISSPAATNICSAHVHIASYCAAASTAPCTEYRQSAKKWRPPPSITAKCQKTCNMGTRFPSRYRMRPPLYARPPATTDAIAPGCMRDASVLTGATPIQPIAKAKKARVDRPAGITCKLISTPMMAKVHIKTRTIGPATVIGSNV